MEAQTTEERAVLPLTRRNPWKVFGLSLITFGIYTLYWLVVTKREMVGGGAEIPTCWLLIVPVASYYWYWKFSKGVEMVTNKEMNGGVAFLLLIFLGVIGMVIVQSELNKVAT